MREPVGPETVVKFYGRASFLGFFGLVLAAAMARLGMDGWRRSTERKMQKDVIEMDRRGYQVVTAEERGFPFLGMTYFAVTYRRAG